MLTRDRSTGEYHAALESIRASATQMTRTVETLVSEPRLTSHAGLTPEARARAGIADGFLRFSIGLEDADDIIADFAQALAQQ